MKNYVLVGPPGSGKGTQAEKLADYLKLPHISTGDIFREIQVQDSDLGRRVKGLLDAAKMIDDATVYDVVLQKLNSPELKEGFVFDGFPRNVDQAEWLEKYRPVTKCVFINVSDEECTARMSSRLICPSCKANYNILYLKPKVEGKCDKCDAGLTVRSDSTPEAIKKRLDDYHKLTEPLKAYYSKKGVLAEVNGEQPIEKVFSDIKGKL